MPFSATILRLGATILFITTSLPRPPALHAQTTPPATPTQRTGYLGDSACINCHTPQSKTYTLTAHHLTSQLPSATSILGSFTKGSNLLPIEDSRNPDEPRLYFSMDRSGDRFSQTAVAELGTKHLTHTESIDLVFGSGVRGQTYLYWTGNELSELPVSYWTDGHQWINSPGYKDGTANFSRHADPRCMECHATYIKALSASPQSYRYDRATLLPGISCETCHGPGSAHVALESTRPHARPNTQDHAILSPARFSRDRQVDACALCHNGTQGIELKPAFSFVPGERLANFIANAPSDSFGSLDVHGNQVGLLKRSRCYLASAAMSCSTCHEVHQPEQSPASYSVRCLQCHAWQSCGASKTLGNAIVSNCIDCHMPLQETNAIVSVTAGKVIKTFIRSHWIKVYSGVQGPERNIVMRSR